MKPTQAEYLDKVVTDEQPHSVFLMNGIKLTGIIKAHDQYTVILSNERGGDQLIYKHSISTVCPAFDVAEKAHHAERRPAQHRDWRRS